MRYLSDQQREALRLYKYKVSDPAAINIYVFRPWWTWSFRVVPMWFVPNLMTIFGVLLTSASMLAVFYYDSGCDILTRHSNDPSSELIPWYVWCAMGLAHLVGNALDQWDGIQARRVGSSGPLGEWFDHGLDAAAFIFVIIPIGVALGGVTVLSPTGLLSLIVGGLIMFWPGPYGQFFSGVMVMDWFSDLSFLVFGGKERLISIPPLVLHSSPKTGKKHHRCSPKPQISPTSKTRFFLC
eukprot:m.156888 g.156888  ORF g.156888 m.156888 type:complete len:239 (-) comp52939_c0_seq23:830-1546(-)